MTAGVQRDENSLVEREKTDHAKKSDVFQQAGGRRLGTRGQGARAGSGDTERKEALLDTG